MQRKRSPEGIDVRHSRKCRSLTDGGKCNCSPSYQAHVWSNADRKRIRRTFRSLQAAKAWRREAQIALDRGTLTAPSAFTLGEALESYLAGMKEGSIFDR